MEIGRVSWNWVDVSDAEAQGIDVRVYYTTAPICGTGIAMGLGLKDLPPDPKRSLRHCHRPAIQQD